MASTNQSNFVRKPGDWNCHQCQTMNFKSRNACFRCSAPHSQSMLNNTGSVATLTSHPPRVSSKPGDWLCPFCNELNFVSRIACFKCNRPKSQETSAPTPMTTMRIPGDWTCSFCNVLNFAARTVCFRCHQEKVAARETNVIPSTISKPSEWRCSYCAVMNFESRTSCRSCNAARSSCGPNQTASDNSNNSKNECVVCMENSIDTAVITCGHSSMCHECSKKINACPVCRTPYNQQQIIKIYYAH